MKLGVDCSTYFEVCSAGVKFYDNGVYCSPLTLFRKSGCEIMRLRLWNDPFSKEDRPYLGGTCDLDNLLRMGKLCYEMGYEIMLDFHYSDFWADPGKQFLPKAWRGLSNEELEVKVYEFTRNTLLRIKEAEFEVTTIQIGNEITCGMMWPNGKLEEPEGGGERTNYPALIGFIKAGIRAAREFSPKSKIILHLERSYDQNVYNEFFGKMQQADVDYDIIGFSYYPYWHGPMDRFFENVNMCKKFGKELYIVEAGYAFTAEDYEVAADGTVHLVVDGTDAKDNGFLNDYPLTKQGQADFTRDFIALCQKNGVDAVVWWEPCWIPGENLCWASPEGQEYIQEKHKDTRNEWANHCLFDYNGEKLPAFDFFKVKK